MRAALRTSRPADVSGRARADVLDQGAVGRRREPQRYDGLVLLRATGIEALVCDLIIDCHRLILIFGTFADHPSRIYAERAQAI